MLRQSLLFFSLLLVTSTGAAKKLYKYQDEQGHWHFSDRAPDSNQPVEIRQLKPAAKHWVRLEQRGDKQSPDFYAINQFPGSVEIAVEWGEQQNAVAEPVLPARFTVPPGSSANLFQVHAAETDKPARFDLSYRFVPGPPISNYGNQTAYLPPIATGSRFQITQGFNGEFSHQDLQNRYAVDIMMPLDTPIYAARSGVVFDVENDYYQTGTEKGYASKANSIRILHDDGSMAIYAHLALEKAQVHPGLTVAAGELIGYSGNTGYSTGPHLHFAVQVNRGMELASVPFLFLTPDNQSVEPFPGQWLSGLPTPSREHKQALDALR